MKVKALLPFATILLTSLAGCGSPTQKSMQANDGSVRIVENPDGPLYICDLKTVKDTIDVPLSELVEDCRIVRFETSDEAMFKAWWIQVSDNYICIRQESDVVIRQRREIPLQRGCNGARSGRICADNLR